MNLAYMLKYHELRMRCLAHADYNSDNWAYWWGHYIRLDRLCALMDSRK